MTQIPISNQGQRAENPNLGAGLDLRGGARLQRVLRRNLSLKIKIVLLALIPILALFYFFISEINGRLELINETVKVGKLSRLSVKISALVHEFQKERGRTGGFTGSDGAEFREELLGQRIVVDAKLLELRNFLTDFNPLEFGVDFNNKYEAAFLALDRVGNHRMKVLALSVSDKEAIDFYTALNASLLDVISQISNLDFEPAIISLIRNYNWFLMGKEYTGIERALGTNAFAQNRFGKGGYEYYLFIIFSQKIYFDNFKKFASIDEIGFFDKKSSDASFAETLRLRNLLMEKSAIGDFGEDPKNWFNLMTTRIDILKEVEGKINADLKAESGNIKRKAEKDLMLFIVIALMILVTVLVLVVRVILSILRPIEKMEQGVEIISSGNLDFQIEV